MNEKKSNAKKNIIFTVISFGALLFGTVFGSLLTKMNYAKYDNVNFRKITEIYDLIKNDWLYNNIHGNIDDFLTDLAIKGMTNGNEDPYTFYTATYAEQNLDTNQKGMGISHAYYGGNRIIVHVFEDSPAAKAGLKAGDVILGMYESSTSSDFINFQDLSKDEVTDTMQAYDEDIIKLRIQKASDLSTTDLTIEKDQFVQKAVSGSINTEDGKTEVYIKIQNFLDSFLPKDFLTLMNTALENNSVIDNLIIDLRDNGGGRTDYASYLASLFVPKDSVIVQYKYNDNSIEKETNDYSPRFMESVKNIKFLQNNGTASASEMFILALKDNLTKENMPKVDVIGTYSYGKGIRQMVRPFSDGSYIRYTDAYVLSPSGYCINGIGIKPTTEVEFDYEMLNYYGEVGFVTKSLKEKILKQINFVLETNYTSYDEALAKYCEVKSLTLQDFNYVIGRSLQKDAYNKYLVIMNKILEIAKGN